MTGAYESLIPDEGEGRALQPAADRAVVPAASSPQAVSPVPASIPSAAPIYIQIVTDGSGVDYIRKWSSQSFDGATIYYPSAGSDFALADIECGPIPLGMAPEHVSALLREIARIADDYDLRQAIEDTEFSPSRLADSFIWRDCIEHAERVAQAIEARRAETLGSACESAVPQGCAQPEQPA